MKVDVRHQPDSTIAHVMMDPQEELMAEAGAMIAMTDLSVSTTLRKGKGGGILGGMKRLLAGESLFLSTFRTNNGPGEIYLAPKLMGDILPYQMTETGLVAQSTSYLASTAGVDVELGFQGIKSLFSGESIFWLNITGNGLVLLNSFGGIYQIDVDGEYIVDTGHIVAFEKSLSFSIKKASASLIGSFLGGEGFVCLFQGKGRLFCQTHNPGAFGQLIGSQLPPR